MNTWKLLIWYRKLHFIVESNESLMRICGIFNEILYLDNRLKFYVWLMLLDKFIGKYYSCGGHNMKSMHVQNAFNSVHEPIHLQTHNMDEG